MFPRVKQVPEDQAHYGRLPGGGVGLKQLCGCWALGLKLDPCKGSDYVILIALCPQLPDQSLVHSRHSTHFCKIKEQKIALESMFPALRTVNSAVK